MENEMSGDGFFDLKFVKYGKKAAPNRGLLFGRVRISHYQKRFCGRRKLVRL